VVYQSILFNQPISGIDIDKAEAPDFLEDLNLDQVIDGITSTKEEYNLKPFFYLPLQDVDSIHYRQEVYHDLEDSRLIESIRIFAKKMVITRRYLALMSKLYNKYHKEGWFLESALVYCDAVTSLADDLAVSEVTSRGLIAFRSALNEYISSPGFISFLEETNRLKNRLSNIDYCVTIKGNSVRITKYHEQPDYSLDVAQSFEKFRQGEVKDYLSRLNANAVMTHVEEGMLDCVAKIHSDIFNQLDEYCLEHASFLDGIITIFDREVQFYVAYLEYISDIRASGLKFCYPQISDRRKEIYGLDGFDLALAHKKGFEGLPVITNDFTLNGPERVIIVSGPNQGGKTTFARMFGQIHYLASLGCPVPCRKGRFYLFDRILTHFEREEDIRNLRGKLLDDLVRIHNILNKATSRSIIILNEIFTSTAFSDAIFLSTRIMKRIMQMDLICIWVTFIVELGPMSEKNVSMVSTIDPDNPAVCTFKIIRKTADGLAYALSIAEKYHLTYNRIKERIQP